MSAEGVTLTEFVGLRVPADLVASLREMAGANERSVSAEVRRAIKAHVDAHRDDVAA